MDKFIKNGDCIYIRPEGEKYDISSNRVYRLLYDNLVDSAFLKIEENFGIPEKIYKNDKDDEFIKKCITTYKITDNRTTGVLLNGLKGSGKTLMAKQIALMSELPIIIIDPTVTSNVTSRFFNKLHGEYCIIFDEFEKNWRTSQLLSLFDGINDDCKKLIICTSNNEDSIDDNFIDRCSRIRYYRTFTKLNDDVIKYVVSDLLKDKSKIEETTKFILDNVEVLSFDNVMLFIDEINNSQGSSLDSLFDDLNLTRKDKQNKPIEIKPISCIDYENSCCCC